MHISDGAEYLTYLTPWSMVILALSAYLAFSAIYNLHLHPLSKIPGPRLWAISRLPFVWSLLRGTIVHDVEKLHRRYGPVLRIAPDEVTYAREDAWVDIFHPRPGHRPFLKDPTWWRSQANKPLTLLSAIEPEEHARFRKLLAPAFTQRALKAQEPVLHRYVNLLVERLRDVAAGDPEKGSEVNIVPWFNFVTFDIFGDLGFGESFECLENSRYHPWIDLLFNSVKAASYIAAARFYPLVGWVLVKCIPPSLRRTQRAHGEQIAEKVSRRLNYELERPDIMSHLIEAKGQKGLTTGELNATFVGLTTAGSETTATVLVGTLNYLVNHPAQFGALTKEIREHFQAESEITLDELRKLPYLHAVIQEGLRLCPPIPWVLPRLVPIGGDTTRVSIQTYTINRDPGYFHSPCEFCPERWLQGAKTDTGSPFYEDKLEAMQVFSTGTRSCMGQHLAWAEMKLVLAKAIWAIDFEAVEGKKVKWEDLRTFLLVEKRPIVVNMKVRQTE
ncbi:Uu.00g009710.m01.CDS01 [Anthostomella pinea]|uniref:Uu.00g009710.m01.CDS01 n=1 Tax=Anthostomella pinea TaxID=933095 RepID=A0AAI8VXG1_9PEZI|nr:Uu.00g009710.m01.CDS01 [Anthostomella pinea]